MANKRFADRGVAVMNGYETLYLKSLSMRRNANLSRADHMTATYASSGYKRGNKHISLSLEFDIAQDKAQFDTAIGDPSVEVKVALYVGAERYSLIGLAEASMELRASVGDAGKNFEYEALDIVNENGESVNVDISLQSAS